MGPQAASYGPPRGPRTTGHEHTVYVVPVQVECPYADVCITRVTVVYRTAERRSLRELRKRLVCDCIVAVKPGS